MQNCKHKYRRKTMVLTTYFQNTVWRIIKHKSYNCIPCDLYKIMKQTKKTTTQITNNVLTAKRSPN